MADRALTEEAVRNGLRDIRLPSEAPGGLAADLLMVVALGLLVAVLISWLARSVTLSRPKAPRNDLHQDLQALSVLSESEQQIALLHLLKSRAPDRYRALSARLYHPGGLPDLAALRAEVLAHD